ncbi:WecB/TagA/CpsF family glycosyltransferase [Rhodococcus sp. KBS0724]|uniref:WecB/TagA/CpsF family glycosyltransferase n=1 Tax=Rhodococcus sp. KBS0724 TaxID=1179674 RepID=UPI00110F20FE|nr:WecB/TagA/CpsF family glycosyltransferase [Rhodococcus sp. KBS0724]TSD48925.1 WecB/TagA/CpsF family glycosyltransferase [Rhodococcus sp. KBS0724]
MKKSGSSMFSELAKSERSSVFGEVPTDESREPRQDFQYSERTIEMWGVRVSPRSSDEVIEWINDHMGKGKRLLVGHNLHSVYLYLTENMFQSVYDSADLVIIDGFPILLLSSAESRYRRQGGISRSKRCGSTDWIPKLSELTHGRRIAVIGSTKSSNLNAITYLESLGTDLEFRGWDGFEELKVLRSSDFSALKEFEPDLVLLGLGMPFQERVISESWEALPDAVYAVIGGAIDQLSGAQRNAPRFLGPLGLEWLWRLMMDPRRLAGRYLVEPLKLIAVTFRIRFLRRQNPIEINSREVM